MGPLDPVTIFTEFSWWSRSRPDGAGYRPLTTLSYALDRHAAGLSLAWLHGINFLLHALVSWLVFEIGLRLGLSRRGSWLAAIAFCLLPIHSEAVIWLVGRAELMAAAGTAGALALLLGYREHRRRAALVAAVALFVAALFSKENAVTLLAAPVLAWLLLPARDRDAARRNDLTAAAALVAGFAAYLAVRLTAGSLMSGGKGDMLDNPLVLLDWPGRLAGALSVLGRYLQLTVWPHPLSIDYSYNALGIAPGYRGDLFTVVGVLACVAVVAATVAFRRKRPALVFCLWFAAACYSIVSNVGLHLGTIMGERLFYLPSLGLCLAAAPALAWLSEAAKGRGGVLLVALALAWAAVDFVRATEWQSPITIFEAATADYPRSARAHMELASAYGAAGRIDDAVASFERALEIWPEYTAAWYNLGNLYARNRRFADAVAAYREALEHLPGFAAAWYNLGLSYQMERRADDAIAALRRATELAPADPGSAMALADAYLTFQRYVEAIPAYTRVLEIDSTAAAALLNRGVAKQRLMGCEAALPDYLAVVRANPGAQLAASNAAGCLEATGRGTEAAAIRRRAGLQ